MNSINAVKILFLISLITPIFLSYTLCNSQDDQQINKIIRDLKKEISLKPFNSLAIADLIDKLQAWTVKRIENGEYGIGISKLNSALEILENTIAESELDRLLRDKMVELKDLHYVSMDFLDEQNDQAIEKITSEISPGDHLIQVNGIGTGTIYFGKDGQFAGYVPTMLLIHQGQNIVSIRYGGHTEYYLELKLNGTVLSVYKADARIIEDCNSPTSTGANILNSWEQKMQGTKADLRKESFMTETQGMVDADAKNCPLNTWAFGTTKFFRLKISSEPPNAEILIDNAYMGNTPKTLLIKRSSSREKVDIVISAEEYIKLAKRHTFKRKSSEVHFKLTPKSNIGLTEK